jgi:ribonuclease HI
MIHLSNKANKVPETPVVTVNERDRDTKKASVNETYTLYFDGGSRGNGTEHAIAGSGFVMYDAQGKEFCKGINYLGKATNNAAEYDGLLQGIIMATRLEIKKLMVKGDSQLVINQMTGKYRVRHPDLKIVNERVQNMCKLFDRVEFKHIDRASNGVADRLANHAMDSKKKTFTLN